MPIKIKIMLRAVRIRTEAGEDLEAVLASYPRLTEPEKQQIREAVKQGTGNSSS